MSSDRLSALFLCFIERVLNLPGGPAALLSALNKNQSRALCLPQDAALTSHFPRCCTLLFKNYDLLGGMRGNELASDLFFEHFP